MLTISVPVTPFFCHLFHLDSERHFMRSLLLPEKQQGEAFLSGSQRQWGDGPNIERSPRLERYTQ